MPTPKNVVKPEYDALNSVIERLPKEFFVRSTRKTVRGLVITLATFVVGYTVLYFIPWYFLPLAWLLLGFSYTAMFSIGFDCSRGSFSQFSIINFIVGSFVFLPLLLPYESWHIQESTCSIIGPVKNLWNGLWKSIYTWIRANIFGLFAFWKAGHRKRIIISMLLVYIGAVVVFGFMVKLIGIWGIVKFWFFPWLAYHFWMSTFYSGVINLPFTRGLSVRFSVSFSKKLPRWLNFLTNDLNFVIGASKKGFERLRDVPSHNLCKAFVMIFNEFNAKDVNSLVSLDTSGSDDPEYLFTPHLITPYVEEKTSHTIASYVEEKASHAITPHVEEKTSQAIASASDSVNYFDLKNINWVTALWILITPILTLIALFTVPIRRETLIFSGICYVLSGLGITVGYHRLFSHRSFSCNRLVKAIILTCGTSAFQNSCIWWATDHRAHHRYVDTDQDPYNINRGFFWAHMGWLLVKQDRSKIGKVDTEDLESDPMLAFQHRYYFPLAITTAIIIPILIAGLGWNDWLGGLFYAAIARSVLVMQSTFCINSVAHYLGDTTFSDKHSPRDCYFVSFLTFGEGYHNFHHEFPYDYRNGVFWHSWDPSKWTIWFLSLPGFAYDLKRFPQNEIEKGRLQMQLKIIKNKLKKLFWGVPRGQLPVYTKEDLQHAISQGQVLLVIDDYVVDATNFIHSHPGGKKLIKIFAGKDATKAFSGSVYDHSNAARNLVSTLRIAVYQE